MTKVTGLPSGNLRLFIWALLFGLSTSSVFAKMTVSNESPAQGQTIEVSFEPDKSELAAQQVSHPYTLSFNKNVYKFLPAPSKSNVVTVNPALAESKSSASDTNNLACKTPLLCLLAIPADLVPGDYKLTVRRMQDPEPLPRDHIGSAESEKKNPPLEEQTIKVQDGKFPVQRLSLPKSKDNFVMAPGEKETVEAAKATLSEERLWQGKFKLPSTARQSAAFGMKRIVNGRLLKDYFHSGLDFAASLGTPVIACADGKVILAHKGYKLHGNVVAIDHGLGVISFYIHLQQILVKEGDMVKAGDKIATVGQTGRANGPHLHFSIYVNQVATNPTQWFHSIF